MSKFERRYEKDTLHPKDIEKWASENSPKEVYQLMQNFWQVNKEPPKIKGVQQSSNDIENLKTSCIPIETKDIKYLKKLFEGAGRKISGDNLLRTILGGRYSVYFLFRLHPEIFTYDFSFCQPGNYNLEDFYDFVSLNSQVKTIDEIGARTIERHLGIYDHAILQNALKIKFEEIEEKTKVNPKKIERALKMLNQIRDLDFRKDSEKEEENRKIVMDNCLDAAVTGTSHFIADDIEKEYSGRFPQLIRKDFKPERKYVDYFNEFVKRYMSTFGMVLKGELSSLKK